MIFYQIGDGAEAWSTNIGEEAKALEVIMPEYQAHSTNVAAIPESIGATYGVDALITDTAGIRIGVRTADCVPILLYDPSRRAAAAIHSGWKGSVGNIIGNTIAAMRDRYGSRPSDMRAVIGPCIHVEAFEVGNEVYDAFASNGYGSFARRMANPYTSSGEVKWHIDLPAVCSAQLMAQGIGEIFTCPYCTYHHHDTLYSYRHSRCADPSQRIITSIMVNT